MKSKLSLQVILFAIIRLIINSVYRMVYPLGAELITGLGINFAQFSRMLTVRSLAGGLSPFIVSFTNKRGHRFGMLLGMLLTITGLIFVVVWPTFPSFFISTVFIIWGKFTFDPSTQAYLGDRVPYAERGRLLAITEYGWSGATLIGIPLASFLIGRAGWMAPFPLFLGMMLILQLALFYTIPAEVPARKNVLQLGKQFKLIFLSGPAIAGLMVTLWISASNEMINLVFSVWLTESFGLTIAALGASSLVLGIAELIGEGGVTLLVDKLGKHRAVFLGALATSLATVLLPFLGSSWQGAFFGLFLIYLAFEFTFVSSIPLMTEIMPNARATFMAVSIAASSIGRAIGALMISYSFSLGILPTAIFAAFINLFAIVALRWIRLPDTP